MTELWLVLSFVKLEASVIYILMVLNLASIAVIVRTLPAGNSNRSPVYNGGSGGVNF